MKIKKFFKNLGPGLVTGVADDDPSGIATYSQAGAMYGLKQLWVTIYILPLMIATQNTCARIGAVNGKGLAEVIKDHYSKYLLYFLVGLMVIANVINIAADIGAMAEALRLLLPINFIIATFLFVTLILLLEVFVAYKTYSKFLKWLTFFLFAYPITIFFIKANWFDVIKATFIPSLEFNYNYFYILTGLLGTTISPYMFFWETSQEVEELKTRGLYKKGSKPKITKKFLKNIRIDNYIGMILSEICAWSIILVCGIALHNAGITSINTAADAAKALQPLMGNLAETIFAVGIIGLGLLAVPVLAGSTSYAVSDTYNIKQGLGLKYKSAKKFYNIIIIATLLGLTINFLNIDPMKALVYSAVVNGVVTIPSLFIITLIASNKNIMGSRTCGLLTKILLWLTFIIMLVSALIMFWSFFV